MRLCIWTFMKLLVSRPLTHSKSLPLSSSSSQSLRLRNFNCIILLKGSPPFHHALSQHRTRDYGTLKGIVHTYYSSLRLSSQCQSDSRINRRLHQSHYILFERWKCHLRNRKRPHLNHGYHNTDPFTRASKPDRAYGNHSRIRPTWTYTIASKRMDQRASISEYCCNWSLLRVKYPTRSNDQVSLRSPGGSIDGLCKQPPILGIYPLGHKSIYRRSQSSRVRPSSVWLRGSRYVNLHPASFLPRPLFPRC